MQDCKVTIELKDGKALISGENCRGVEGSVICGALAQSVGLAMVESGMSLDDVKGILLDVHLSAMDNLTRQVIRERGERHAAI